MRMFLASLLSEILCDPTPPFCELIQHRMFCGVCPNMERKTLSANVIALNCRLAWEKRVGGGTKTEEKRER